ncbi:hypothetical protein IKP94_04070 [Candidatus Saccharibacteria bacterium]|nr:hypothetical protein [Candidatus Saccharibacteria bacterium]
MSSIYDKNIKEIRKELVRFGKTTYGKTIFFIAYLIPIALFFALIIFAILGFASDVKYLISYMPHLFIGFVVSFILANAYYYKELRIFVDHKN